MNTGQGQPLPQRHSRQHQIVTAGPADTAALSQVIADAFHDLPQSKWLIPDPDARQRILPGYFQLLTEQAMDTGTVHTTTDRAAAALWIPVSPKGASQSDDYPARLAAVTGPWADRFTTFDTVLDRHHPRGVAYHYLAILAVRPDRQDEGIGSALLRAYHEVLDREADALAYLEAAEMRSRQLAGAATATCPAARSTCPATDPECGPWSGHLGPGPCGRKPLMSVTASQVVRGQNPHSAPEQTH